VVDVATVLASSATAALRMHGFRFRVDLLGVGAGFRLRAEVFRRLVHAAAFCAMLAMVVSFMTLHNRSP
jgi:hypothetical protein